MLLLLWKGNPTREQRHDLFSRYPVSLWGWIWATTSAAVAIWLTAPHIFVTGFVSWMLLLIALRAVFFAYNRMTPVSRVPIYGVLQALKNFGAVVVMTPSIPGLLVGAAHAVQQFVVYKIYRSGGDKALFKRELARMIVFTMGAAIVVVLGWGAELLSWTTLTAVLWLSHRLVIERYGSRWSFSDLSLRCGKANTAFSWSSASTLQRRRVEV